MPMNKYFYKSNKSSLTQKKFVAKVMWTFIIAVLKTYSVWSGAKMQKISGIPFYQYFFV